MQLDLQRLREEIKAQKTDLGNLDYTCHVLNSEKEDCEMKLKETKNTVRNTEIQAEKLQKELALVFN